MLALPEKPRDARAEATDAADDPALPFIEGMQLLQNDDLQRFSERMEELTYLANVLVAGADLNGSRLRPSEAAEAVLATVALGAELEVRDRRHSKRATTACATAIELLDVLRECPADLLFRKASSKLETSGSLAASPGFLHSRSELDDAVDGN